MEPQTYRQSTACSYRNAEIQLSRWSGQRELSTPDLRASFAKFRTRPRPEISDFSARGVVLPSTDASPVQRLDGEAEGHLPLSR